MNQTRISELVEINQYMAHMADLGKWEAGERVGGEDQMVEKAGNGRTGGSGWIRNDTRVQNKAMQQSECCDLPGVEIVFYLCFIFVFLFPCFISILYLFISLFSLYVSFFCSIVLFPSLVSLLPTFVSLFPSFVSLFPSVVFSSSASIKVKQISCMTQENGMTWSRQR